MDVKILGHSMTVGKHSLSHRGMTVLEMMERQMEVRWKDAAGSV